MKNDDDDDDDDDGDDVISVGLQRMDVGQSNAVKAMVCHPASPLSCTLGRPPAKKQGRL